VALGKDQGITHALQVAQWQHRRSGSSQERLAKQMDAFPKTSTHKRRMKMTKHFFSGLSWIFGGNPRAAIDQNLLTYAKTEYGKDWSYAYEHMLANNGQPPKYRADLSTNKNLTGWI
jgi:hypothetical protein